MKKVKVYYKDSLGYSVREPEVFETREYCVTQAKQVAKNLQALGCYDIKIRRVA